MISNGRQNIYQNTSLFFGESMGCGKYKLRRLVNSDLGRVEIDKALICSKGQVQDKSRKF